jgi:hypothetical protein
MIVDRLIATVRTLIGKMKPMGAKRPAAPSIPRRWVSIGHEVLVDLAKQTVLSVASFARVRLSAG